MYPSFLKVAADLMPEQIPGMYNFQKYPGRVCPPDLPTENLETCHLNSWSCP